MKSYFSSLLWTHKDIDKALNINCPNFSATGVSIDTRNLEKGDLFIALKGPKNDGHDYICQAINKGASAIIVSQMRPYHYAVPIIFVEEITIALHHLAIYARARTKACVIGITGSVGKTSTKEMLKIALSSFGTVSASIGGLNNHWGVPLSLMRIPQNADYAVLEIGMNHTGEIGALSKIVKPHHAIITMVEAVHIAFFGSLEEIALAKLEIIQGLQPNGQIIINHNTPCFSFMEKILKKKNISYLTYGYNTDSIFHIKKITSNFFSSTISGRLNSQDITYTINTPANHLAFNTGAIITMIYLLRLNQEKAILSLKNFSSLKGRGEIKCLKIQEKKIYIMDESYNASLIAVKAALKQMQELSTYVKGRSIFIFGGMAELGDHVMKMYLDLLTFIKQTSIDIVHCISPYSLPFYKTLPAEKKGYYQEKSTQLNEKILNGLHHNDFILIKGSAVAQLHTIIDTLIRSSSSYAHAL